MPSLCAVPRPSWPRLPTSSPAPTVQARGRRRIRRTTLKHPSSGRLRTSRRDHRQAGSSAVLALKTGQSPKPHLSIPRPHQRINPMYRGPYSDLQLRCSANGDTSIVPSRNHHVRHPPVVSVQVTAHGSPDLARTPHWSGATLNHNFVGCRRPPSPRRRLAA